VIKLDSCRPVTHKTGKSDVVFPTQNTHQSPERHLTYGKLKNKTGRGSNPYEKAVVILPNQ
jgi:hypothetical protein